MRREAINSRPINVGLIGFGTVGTGVVRYFNEGNADRFGVNLTRVAVRDSSKTRSVQFSSLTTNAADIINDPDIDIVVELMGGVGRAKDYMFDAINLGKSVVTANKAVMSRHMKELFDVARSQSVDLAFEAAVGGGIPIIETFNRYQGDRINRVMAIINGTTNYILTRMEEGADFDPALADAQEKGFAEKPNHILDTGGFDSRDKLAVLASLAFNTQVNVEDIPCRGIADITSVDIDFAREYGYAIRLLAIAQRYDDGKVELRVNPALIKREHPLASIRDEFNALYVESRWAGPQTFTGRGAGADPTAIAVISDILHVAENIRKGTSDELPTLDSKVKYVDPGDIRRKGYMRVNLKDVPGSLHAVTGILYKHRLNLKNSIQRESFAQSVNGHQYIPDIITVDPAPQRVIEAALKEIRRSKSVYGTPFFLSFEE